MSESYCVIAKVYVRNSTYRRGNAVSYGFWQEGNSGGRISARGEALSRGHGLAASSPAEPPQTFSGGLQIPPVAFLGFLGDTGEPA